MIKKLLNTFLPAMCVGASLFATSCTMSDRHLIFFTNTTVGLDVGSDPSSGTPVKAVIGYKRQEGVLDPVYDEKKSTTTTEPGKPTVVVSDGGLRDQAYSVIAKYQGTATVTERAEVSNGQWFATGLAAERLAQAPGIAGAVTGNSKVAEAAAKEAGGLFGKTSFSLATQNRSIVAVMTLLEELADKEHDVDAKVLVLRVSEMARRFEKSRIRLVDDNSPDPTTGEYKLVASGQLIAIGTSDAGWQRITKYRQGLEDSVAKLTSAIDSKAKVVDEAGAAVDALKTYDETRGEQLKVQQELSESEDLRAAVQYALRHMGG